MIHPLFCFYAYYRIFACRPPVLKVTVTIVTADTSRKASMNTHQ